MKSSDHPPVLMLSTIHAGHSGHSGYGRLAEYVPGAEFIHAPRLDPRREPARFLARVARRFAFSRWYLGGSAALEWKTLRRMMHRFAGVVHSMWADHDLGYIDLLTDRKRVKFCGTFHNCPDDFEHTLRFPGRVRKFDAVILMSECQRAFFLDAGVPEHKIHVVLHGVDTDYFVPTGNREAHAGAAFTVISVGGFRRNFPLLRAICESLAPLPHIRFKVIAPESWRQMFSNLPNTEFLSGLNDARLLGEYQGASCLLHTAEHATANNALLEAMACGVPVVAERVGGIPEYVTGDSALLTTHGDGDALAGAIQSLADSPETRATMGVAARRRAEELSWPHVAGRMLELYNAL